VKAAPAKKPSLTTSANTLPPEKQQQLAKDMVNVGGGQMPKASASPSPKQ
jgi:hypothetical protein